MVARVVPTSNVFVHLGLYEARCDIRAEQKVIEPETRIPAESVPEVIPEGVDLLAGVKFPDGVGPPLP